MNISRDYGVLLEDERIWISLRGLFIIDPKGTLGEPLSLGLKASNFFFEGQITVNDLPVGRSVEETIRLLQAFQFTVRWFILYIYLYVLHSE